MEKISIVSIMCQGQSYFLYISIQDLHLIHYIHLTDEEIETLRHKLMNTPEPINLDLLRTYNVTRNEEKNKSIMKTGSYTVAASCSFEKIRYTYKVSSKMAHVDTDKQAVDV